MNGSVEALAVVAVGSLLALAGSEELLGVLDVLDGATPLLPVEVGSVLVVGVVGVVVVFVPGVGVVSVFGAGVV